MTKSDRNLIKATLERISEIIKERGGIEPSGPLASTTDSSTRTYSTESPLPISGPKRERKTKQAPYRDYMYGQRGKNEAGKTKPGITSLPSEPTQTRTPPTDYGTPYVND